jgi:hypothetical protein
MTESDPTIMQRILKFFGVSDREQNKEAEKIADRAIATKQRDRIRREAQTVPPEPRPAVSGDGVDPSPSPW